MTTASATRLTCLGVDHTFAGPQARALLVLSPDQQADLLQRLRRVAPAVEAVLLSTCSRTELYLAGPGDLDVDELWHAVLMATGRTEAACRSVGVVRRRRDDVEAVRHLFRVAAGLESRLLGEPEILGQVRDALAFAQRHDAVGKVLHRTMRMALEIGKQARASTDISTGGTGIGAAVAATVADWEADHGPARVLLLGAGTVAASSLAQLRRHTGAAVTVVNRTRSRADDLAGRHGAEVGAWRRRADLLAAHDVVVSAVASDVAVLSHDQLLAGAATGGLTCIDTSLPSTLPVVPGIRHLGLDDLDDRRDELGERRRAAVPEVERMVDAMVAGWDHWRANVTLDDTFAALYRAVDRRDHAQLATALGVQEQELARMDRATLRRVLHAEVVRRRGEVASRTRAGRA